MAPHVLRVFTLTLLQKVKRQGFSYTVHRGAVIYGACMEPGYGTDETRLPTTDKILMMLGRATRSYPVSDRQACVIHVFVFVGTIEICLRGLVV